MHQISLHASRLLALSLVAAALAPSAALAADGSTAPAGIDVTFLDRGVRPCDDFFRFANGGWIAKNPIPQESPSWGTAGIIRERTSEQLRTILEAAAKSQSPKGSNEQKIGDFYFSALDAKSRDAAGVAPLAPWLERIEAAKDARDLQDVWAYLATYNVDSPFGIGSAPDFKKSSQEIASVGQGGYSLPDRDYYLKEDEKSKSIRDAYLAHVAKTFELAGESAERAAADAAIVMKIETRLAAAALSRIERRDPNASYHVMSPEERAALTPRFDWDRYLSNVGLAKGAALNVAHPKFFKEVDAMLADVPVGEWKAYLRWRLLDFLAPMLSTAFEQEDFEFNGRVLNGANALQAPWKRAVSATSARLGDAVGEVYVRRFFPPEAKRRIEQLVANLKAALRDDIRTLDWMSEPTRQQALAKLDALVYKVGFPEKWRDYSRLEVDRRSYALNTLRAQHWAFVTDLEKAGKPVDRAEWRATPQLVNAGYFPLANEIVFPAAILQAPLFDPSADDAVNYGAIGAVIGHEMTHGFDDQGARFDADGNLRLWWTPDDYMKFQARTKCVEDQFSAYALEDGTHVKGALVKGEAIADLGGLKIAWLAYRKSLEGKPRPKEIDGFTPEQRFFLGFGQAWKNNATPQYELLQTNTDPHPLPRFRLNGTVANMPEFFEAFGCGDTGRLVRGEGRCTIW
jgi:putative endopeptidase